MYTQQPVSVSQADRREQGRKTMGKGRCSITPRQKMHHQQITFTEIDRQPVLPAAVPAIVVGVAAVTAVCALEVRWIRS
jgi:hypothetical protein